MFWRLKVTVSSQEIKGHECGHHKMNGLTPLSEKIIRIPILKVRWNFEKIKQISIRTGLTTEKEILSMMMWKRKKTNFVCILFITCISSFLRFVMCTTNGCSQVRVTNKLTKSSHSHMYP